MNWIILVTIILVILIAVCIARYLTHMTTKEISGAAGETVSLTNEYARWQVAQEQLQTIMSTQNARQNAYEVRAIFERWQLTLANNADPAEAARKMRGELLEKGIYREPSEADTIIARIQEHKTHPRTSKDKLVVSGGLIKYGAYTGRFSADRIALLRKYASTEHIAATALRYATLAPGGQQWSVPARVYDVLVERFGVSLEGFASPFNSQLLRHRQPSSQRSSRDVQFCSLFLDTDAIFGSIGNFFDCDLAGRVSVINPPYIVSLMEAATKKILATFEEASTAAKPTRMFIVVPNWADADYFAALAGSHFLEKQMTHGKGTSFFEEGDRVIPATFGTTVFILSNNMPPLGAQDDDIARLESAFKLPKK